MTVWQLLSHPLVRLAGGAAVLLALVWQVGAESFVSGLRQIDATTLAVAVLVTLPVIVCCALRWRLVARRFGVDLPLGPATAAYYRATFLNCVLPGGVLGDVHRAVRHGLETDDAAATTRAVVGERVAGQVVQVAGVLVCLTLPGSPLPLPWPVAACAGAVLLALLLRWPGVVLASVLAVAGFVGLFLVAAHATGITAHPTTLLPIALLVLVAMAVPINVAGWGPREGVAAWAFAAADLDPGAGVATSVVYGVMTLVASLPGALVLALDRAPVRSPARTRPAEDLLRG